ncbi:MAG TPA: class I SAM-dependent methyltransferase [Chthonomonadaceae bacterium]|nr:class I SAM-dependent methyltransferase [Chthonomonadaceae bacterium]
MDVLAVHKETGVAWNEVADRYSHGKRDEAEVIAFLQSGGNYLFEAERQILGDLKPWCRSAIHLQCSGGLDALSLLRQGAAEVVGVDISERLLASARRKAEALGAPASWYGCDILQTPEVLNGTADLVYTGKGAICWMMDIAAWAAVVARLLKPGGRLFLYEGHPLNGVWDTEAGSYVLHPEDGNYFSDQIKEGLPIEGSAAVARHRYWTLGQVLNSVCGAGLKIERFQEYPEPFWNEFPNMPAETQHRLPHAYALLARKP